MGYPAIYHRAVRHLIDYGPHNGNTQVGRDLCADALRAIRRTQGRAAALREQYHLHYIAGCLPMKGTK